MCEAVIRETVYQIPKKKFEDLLKRLDPDVEAQVLTYGASEARVSEENVNEQCRLFKEFGVQVNDLPALEKAHRAVWARMESKV